MGSRKTAVSGKEFSKKIESESILVRGVGQRHRRRAAKPEEIFGIEKRPRDPLPRQPYIPASPTKAAQRAPRGLCAHPSSLLGLPHRRTGLGLRTGTEREPRLFARPRTGGGRDPAPPQGHPPLHTAWVSGGYRRLGAALAALSPRNIYRLALPHLELLPRSMD